MVCTIIRFSDAKIGKLRRFEREIVVNGFVFLTERLRVREYSAAKDSKEERRVSDKI